MIRKGFLMIGICTLLVFGFSFQALAVDEAALAEETVAYIKSTAKDSPTPPSVVMAKVAEAVKVLEAEGEAGFPKFKGKDSPFLYEGTYMWVHSLKEAKMLMHPVKYKMAGKALMGLKDKKGKRFFVTMNALAKDKGEGWVDYYWPIPGTNDVVHKISYIKYCKMAGGTEVVIGSGLYNTSHPDVAKLEIH